MALWSRVFRVNATSTSACPSSCYNVTSADQLSTKPTILDDMPTAATSVADAVGYWVDQLRRRMAAKALVTSTTDTNYTVELRRGQRTDSIGWQTDTNGAYPLQITYTTASDSGSGRFENVHHAIDWLIDRLA